MKLQELLGICREYGATAVKAKTEDAGPVELTLDPRLAPPPEVAPKTEEELLEEQMRAKQVKVGRDGLTAEEQEDLYMTKMTDTQD